MITILLDSSNVSLTVALAKDNVLLEEISYEAWQEQSEHMIPELDKLLTKYNVTKEDIGEVIVSVGPGSYTGVRISLTIAKVLAVTGNIKLFPISSLRCLMNFDKPSICLINARSNRSYIGVYHKGEIILPDQIMTNDEIRTYIANHPEYEICGETKYLNLNPTSYSLAENMIKLRPFLKESEEPLGLKPVYLKD